MAALKQPKPQFAFRTLVEFFPAMARSKEDLLKSIDKSNWIDDAWHIHGYAISSYISIRHVDSGHVPAAYGKAAAFLTDWITNGGMLDVSNDTIYFEVIIGDGWATLYSRYNQIIGSRLLARLDFKATCKTLGIKLPRTKRKNAK